MVPSAVAMDNGPASLSETDVHVWKLRLDGLSPEAARAACRQHVLGLLGRYLGEKPPDVRLSIGPYGKPALDRATHRQDIQFNVSHSGGVALIALAEARRVGIDIQRMEERPGLEALLKGASIVDLADGSDAAALYGGWVRTEAAVKAVGGSLPAMARRLEVSADPRATTQAIRMEASSWLIQDLSVDEGYAAALCYERPRAAVFRWDSQLPGRGSGAAGAAGPAWRE